LAEFRSTTGEPFLYYWCDREGDINRWIVVRTLTQELARYFVGIATLRDLIVNCRDRFVYLLDLDRADELHAAFFIAVTALPTEYVPTERSHYNSANRRDSETLQDVFVDETWDYQQVSEYPRKYLQAYGFNALFGQHGDARELRSVGYRLTQGYVYNTLFVNFGAHVPRDKRASLAEVSVASPGYVRFHVDPTVASDLRHAVTLYLANRESIDGDASFLARWANGREVARDQRISEIFVRLCTRLNIRADEILSRVETLQIAVNAFRSYLNRLAYLAQKDESKAAMIVGLDRPRAPSSDRAE
jgi:hypothetical protein